MFKKRGQAKDWETILAGDIPDEGLLSKLHKALLKPDRNMSNIISKWAKYRNRCRIEENTAMEEAVGTREQGDAITEPLAWLTSKNTGSTQRRQDEETGPFLCCWWNCEMVPPCRKTVWQTHKTKYILTI